MKTRLLIGSADAIYRSDRRQKNRGVAGVFKTVTPDQESVPVELAKGEHTLRFEVEAKNAAKASSPLPRPGSEADVSEK